MVPVLFVERMNVWGELSFICCLETGSLWVKIVARVWSGLGLLGEVDEGSLTAHAPHAAAWQESGCEKLQGPPGWGAGCGEAQSGVPREPAEASS